MGCSLADSSALILTRLVVEDPEREQHEGGRERNQEIKRDHAGRLAPAVAQVVSLPAEGRRDRGRVSFAG
jgi:hypothetical protein